MNQAATGARLRSAKAALAKAISPAEAMRTLRASDRRSKLRV